MKIGSLVYATEQGLGHLAKNFFDAGILTDVAIVAHGHRKEHPEWYPCDSIHVSSFYANNLRSLRRFCEKMDCMLFFETPFVWELLTHCREIGVPTVLMPMYECLPPPSKLPFQPDRFLCPSRLDFFYYEDPASPGRAEFIPIPLPSGKFAIPFRKRERANVFVHNAGWGGLKGRNGSEEFYAALQHLKKPTKVILRTQKQLHGVPGSTTLRIGNAEVDYRLGTFDRRTLWDEGDVFVFPERFNGLSLPLQEARASGMLVLTTYRFPNLDWLAHDTLISPERIVKNRVADRCVEFDDSVPSPRNIAAMMDYWNGEDISSRSLEGKEWAEQNSWDALRPRYVEYFERVVAECSKKRG